MVLTKKDEMEAKKVYLDFMQSYMTYDVGGYDSFLDDDFQFVGSAVAEEFLTRKESTDFFEETGEQINGKIELRNRMITTQIIGTQILVGETNDGYVFYEDEWIYYGRFRVSCLLRKNGDSWKLFHLHISNPDTKAQEGDTIGTEQIAAENLQLRDAVKRRTVELEQKNRELEIEASLERVRARAMAMQKSDELSDLVDTVFKELTKLDFALSWCIINIIDESSLSNVVWAANPNIDKAPDSYHMKFEDYPFHDAMMKGYKEQATKFIYVLEGIEKKVYDEYLFKDTEFRKVPEEAQAASRAMEKYVCSFTFSNFGGLQTVGEEPLSDANLDILARFGKVFDLTYTRFNDLKQAEAQARESQIQLALERIRARTMAMHKSSELSEAGNMVFQQIKYLGINAESSWFWFIDLNTDTIEIWTTHENKLAEPLKVKASDFFTFQRELESWKNNEPFLKLTIPKQDAIKLLMDIFRIKLNNKKGAKNFHLLQVRHNYGFLGLGTWYEATEEEMKICARFAKVFEQTYTRFLDLQKAEAQAREAQIEASLERVRAKAMAMHNSGDLSETTSVVFAELRKLGINPIRSGVVLLSKNSRKALLYAAATSSESNALALVGPLNFSGHPCFDQQYESWSKKENYFTALSGEELESYYKVLSAQLSGLSLSEQRFQQEEYGYYLHFSEGYFYAWSDKLFEENEINILDRFKAIIGLTFRRYLDLQKAEAQARESEIELALERVRARTMAMQKSEELKEVIQLVYEQFVQLNIFIEHTGFIMDYKARDDMHIWLADKNEVPFEVTIPYFDCAHWNNFNEAKEKGMDFFANKLDFEEKNKFYKDLSKLIPGMPEESLEFLLSCPGLAISTVLLDNVGLYIENFSGIPYSEEDNKILMRFGKVFQQTYTRFLDLQKAEAQAREAQIEAALEKVRSRSIGMQKSDELKEVIQVVYEQFVHLKINVDHAGFVVDYKPKGDWHFWIADQQEIPSKITHPYFESVWANQFNEAKEIGADFFATNLNFEEKNKFYNELLSYVPGLPEESIDFYLSCPGLAGSTVLFDNVSLYIENFSGIPYSDEENKILMRFGKVFQQTYTRFLDLKRAEARAREAQIEAALERVRARTMVMHKGNELADTAILLFEQITELGIIPRGCGFLIMDEESESMEDWSANLDEKGKASIVTGTLAFDQHPMISDVVETWRRGQLYFIGEIHGEDLQKYYEAVTSKESTSKTIQDQVLSKVHSEFTNSFYFDYGMMYVLTAEAISKDEIDIMLRFAKVFKQTYTRFLDLKKAEAQAREAQIEAALEKVRSRTMAMQRSDELAETASILFKQLINLGIEPNRLYIAIIKDDNGNVEFWITDEDGSKVSSGFSANLRENSSFQKMYEGWKKQIKSLTLDMQGKELKEYFQHLGKLNVPFKGGLSQKRRVQNIAYFSQGFIGIASPDLQPEETTELLERFAAVFNLTYTRFNDLKQAEAQNKIIQAENERKTMELEEARQLQLSMLPKELPKLTNLDIAVYMQTATEVGGDYYDFQVGMDGTLTTVIGDATGHGMKAGTVVTITKSLFNSMATYENILSTFDKISQVIKGMKFRRLAMCLMMMKIRGNRLSMSSAAMPPALIYRKKNKLVEEIFLKGMPLGTMKKFPYKKIESRLHNGDTILLLSDGLPELANNKSEMYGYDRIKTEFHSVGEKEPEEIVNYLKNSASQWTNGKAPDDDVTFVVIKMK